MKTRLLVSAAALACGVAALLAPPAAADRRPAPQPGVDYGGDAPHPFGDGGYDDPYWPRSPQPAYRRYPPPPADWEWSYPNDDEIVVWVTCAQGRQILFNRGYYDVKTDNCRGPNYRYTASREGRRFDIRMSSSGEINRVRLAR